MKTLRFLFQCVSLLFAAMIVLIMYAVAVSVAVVVFVFLVASVPFLYLKDKIKGVYS